jgi:hypothetical protein
MKGSSDPGRHHFLEHSYIAAGPIAEQLEGYWPPRQHVPDRSF